MSMLGQSLGFRLDHRWVPAHVSAYLDGELDLRGRARMHRHARACPECGRLLQSVREMLALLRAQPPTRGAATADLVAAVRARLAEPVGWSSLPSRPGD